MFKSAFIVFICSSLFFSACQKCVTCKQVSAQTDSLSITYPETCGSRKDINEYIDRLERNKPDKNVIECTEKKPKPWE